MKLRSWRVKLIPAAKGRFAEHCDVFATNSGGREIQYAASRHPRHIVSTVTKCARRRLAQPPIGPASLEGSSRASRHLRPQRSEERRVGKEGVSTCRSRWSP